MKQSLFTITTFARISIKRFFRDKTALFFTVGFPLIFLIIFGGLFGKNTNANFNVGLINQSTSEFSKTFVNQLKSDKIYKISPEVTTLDQARQKISQSQIDAAIILPADFGQIDSARGYPTGQATVLYSQNNEQAGQTLQSVLQGTFNGVNATLVKTDKPFTVTSKTTNDKGLSRFDYTFSGLLGFSILGLGIFGPINYFPRMKEQGILRRLHITPLKVWEYFLSSVLSNAIIGLFAIGVLFMFALTVFHFRMVGNYAELAILIVFGIFSIFGIGLALGGWAKNENQAAPLGNLVSFPMMFLSGTFFPRFLMPEWLQHVTNFLPLTPVIDGIRMIATEGKHLVDLGPQLGLMALWTIVIYAIAFRVFRWE